MIIQYASDLHLAFPLNYQYVTSKGLPPEGDVLRRTWEISECRSARIMWKLTIRFH